MKNSTLLKSGGITLLFMLYFSNFSFSQEITVHGQVKDIFNRAMIGANVKLKGTTIEVLTDSMGIYQITVPVKGKLIFYLKGFEKQTIAVKGKSIINVSFNLDLNNYKDIKVETGPGIAKKTEPFQSSTSVDKKLLDQNKEVDIAQLLQSVPGIKIIYEGSEIKILIRGLRSLTSNNYALIVLNGSTYYGSLNDLDRDGGAGAMAVRWFRACAGPCPRTAPGCCARWRRR